MTSPFLLYHKIDLPSPDAKVKGAFTSPKVFARQLEYLKHRGFQFATTAEMAEHFAQHGEFPKGKIAITFDDGWKDNYTYAFPILKRFGIPATVFLVSSCLGKTSDLVTAEGEGPREHLSVEDVRSMSEAGIEFGSHTHTHKHLHTLDTAEIDSELRTSKGIIEDITQRECTSFAYPAGFFNETAKTAVRDAGYKIGLTTVYAASGKPDIFALNRTEILRRDRLLFRFRRKIAELAPLR